MNITTPPDALDLPPDHRSPKYWQHHFSGQARRRHARLQDSNHPVDFPAFLWPKGRVGDTHIAAMPTLRINVSPPRPFAAPSRGGKRVMTFLQRRNAHHKHVDVRPAL